MDVAKVAAALQAGGKMPIGANVEFLRAEYRYLDLRSLMSIAYGVKPYQIAGPDWMTTTKFDIVAKMPEGSKKDDASKMLQTLLEERFKLTTHRASSGTSGAGTGSRQGWAEVEGFCRNPGGHR